ncbi:MAG: DUF3641 domain-containing protein [Ktedonobacteraceae bacterium]|nr:DUF3641 domain-containing protein [Ktedonobacteraceae bacterium]
MGDRNSCVLIYKREKQIGQHCFGCTSGSGSSCGGTTA